MRCIALLLAVLMGASATPVSADFYSLLTAARLDDLDTVRRLLAAGDDPNPFGPGDGYAPVQFAAEHNNAEMVRLLLAAGADPEYRDHNGERALLWAANDGAVDTMRLLLAAGWRTDHTFLVKHPASSSRPEINARGVNATLC